MKKKQKDSRLQRMNAALKEQRDLYRRRVEACEKQLAEQWHEIGALKAALGALGGYDAQASVEKLNAADTPGRHAMVCDGCAHAYTVHRGGLCRAPDCQCGDATAVPVPRHPRWVVVDEVGHIKPG